MVRDVELQKLLWSLFQIEVPIVQVKRNPLPTTETRIVSVYDGGCGDVWSGFVYGYGVTLENFVRPDTGKLLVFRHEHTEHDLSGQIDSWEGEVQNILPEEYESFLDLVHIRNAGLYLNNHLVTQVSINGERVKMLQGEQ